MEAHYTYCNITGHLVWTFKVLMYVCLQVERFWMQSDIIVVILAAVGTHTLAK